MWPSGLKKPDNATARRLNAADLLSDVYQRAKYANGVSIKEESVREGPELVTHLLTEAPPIPFFGKAACITSVSPRCPKIG